VINCREAACDSKRSFVKKLNVRQDTIGENTLNWDAVGAVAEAIGATGVIASLLYVAMQVRASTRASTVEAKLASSRMYTDFVTLFVKSPELYELFLRARKDLESLDPAEYYQFSHLALVAFSVFSAGYFQYSKGTLTEDDWLEYRVVINFWVKGKGFQQWWNKLGKLSFAPPFVEFVESAIAKENAA